MSEASVVTLTKTRLIDRIKILDQLLATKATSQFIGITRGLGGQLKPVPVAEYASPTQLQEQGSLSKDWAHATTVEELKSVTQGNLDRIKSLFTERLALKRALTQANASTDIEFLGDKYSVLDLMDLRAVYAIHDTTGKLVRPGVNMNAKFRFGIGQRVLALMNHQITGIYRMHAELTNRSEISINSAQTQAAENEDLKKAMVDAVRNQTTPQILDIGAKVWVDKEIERANHVLAEIDTLLSEHNALTVVTVVVTW